MKNNIIDNKQYGLVKDVLKNNIEENSKLSIAAAFFSIYAYYELKDELEKIDNLRFIFTQPAFIKAENKLLKDKIKINEAKLFGTEEEYIYRNKLNTPYIAREFAKWVQKKVELKSIKECNIDGSLYHITRNDKNVVIIGGVPFTTTALGVNGTLNTHISAVLEEENKVNDYIKWFEGIWNNNKLLKDIKGEILNKVELLYKDYTPEFIYFVTLYNIFREFLEDNERMEKIQARTGFKDTLIWKKLYNFQKDAVLGAINKIETYGGCIIADSVGLGKTFEALAVIKYYELKNYRVLVLTPKKLRDNWAIYRENDKRNILLEDRFSFDLLNHTDLSRKTGKSGNIDLEYINWGNYDLVVIDESHNFRNNEARNDRKTRYEKLMRDIIKSGIKTKVLMLSATPVNNRLQDLKNQIAFITEGKDDALLETANIQSINKTLQKAQSQFNKWSSLEEHERTTERLLEMLNWDYFKLLDTLTIARSRKHIEKYYNVKEIGKFPIRNKPINFKEEVDVLNQFPSIDKINNEILRLKLSVYSPMKYILPHRREYYNKRYDTVVRGGKSVFKQTDRENSLIYLMKSSLFKRLESSVYSFSKTIRSIIENIDSTLNKIDLGYQNVTYNFDDINEISEEYEELFVGDNVKILLHDMDLIKWRQDLLFDKQILEELLKKADMITPQRDKKLQRLKSVIEDKINNPINEGNKKVIVFTAFADTAEYIYENINKWAREKFNIHSALVTGSGNPKTTMRLNKIDFNSILLNFSPISKERSRLYKDIQEEIDILIATDCISEGQNLQDCDFLINYDIHWNPVRIIQRFGRIDRIGSKNERIQLVNFWPSIELDEYINLIDRVKERMVMMDVSATGEENLIDEKVNEMKDLEYRRKQLLSLQNEVIDLEDISGNISLTDFTLDDFRMDLLNYLEIYNKDIENAPKGIYAVVKNENINLEQEIERGVIFCLKQNKVENNENLKNPLYPYYLIYVKEDGEILYTHTNVKKILDIYRSLCLGKKEVYKELVDEFNKDTKYCKNMDKYYELLRKATEDIKGKVEEYTTLSIFQIGNLENILGSTKIDIDDFEIITFLVIR
ncbi:helicase-related protein [Caloramator proteoclasticus]|uniref:Superfamily II DNA or RNA helicase, SNF2 family n=1 Tax=Caloramator proteoclasticus DSM 10124 TaxID=1121262 RepID=A0A1M5BAA8_9CLOT|nr:helicase-related protein [Caloramator proteoclasticus]SHF39370.1 Superfamily II DNA or RNA helicase, SNF2 family [Caloramator proteoclasticus DSM 10124]